MSDVGKFHSVIRWGKPIAELEAFTNADKNVANAKDEKNGNQAIHLAAQNGHIEITKWLCDKCGADVNGQNGKGQTALHMSVAYDFYEQTKYLLSKGAKTDIKNAEGNLSIEGIDGDKKGADAWDAPVNQLKAVQNKADVQKVFELIKTAPKESLDKATLVQTGMAKKKALGREWDHAAFMEIMKAI